jgi:hypothetical protein
MASGRQIERKMRHWLAPSSIAASSSSRGMDRNWSVQIQITMGRVKVRYIRISARWVSRRPSSRLMRKTGKARTTGLTKRLVMNQNQRSVLPRNSNLASA